MTETPFHDGYLPSMPRAERYVIGLIEQLLGPARGRALGELGSGSAREIVQTGADGPFEGVFGWS
jgi:hypothetical protein